MNRLCAISSIVGQLECGRPVSAKGRSEKREQRRILAYRQGLTVRSGPPLRGKIEPNHPDLAEIWFCQMPPRWRTCYRTVLH